jgi:hypothetical protein
MGDQLDFGVNWVKDFSVRRTSVFMDTLKKNSTWIISSPATVAPLYHVMQLTWFP